MEELPGLWAFLCADIAVGTLNKPQSTPKEVGALWTCPGGKNSQSSACRRLGKGVKLGFGEDGMRWAALWKGLWFLHFILNAALGKVQNLKGRVWSVSPFIKLSAWVVGWESLSLCSYESLIQLCHSSGGRESPFPEPGLELLCCRSSRIDWDLLGLREALKCSLPQISISGMVISSSSFPAELWRKTLRAGRGSPAWPSSGIAHLEGEVD